MKSPAQGSGELSSVNEKGPREDPEALVDFSLAVTAKKTSTSV